MQTASLLSWGGTGVSDLTVEKQHNWALKTNLSLAISLTEVMTSQKTSFAFQYFDLIYFVFAAISRATMNQFMSKLVCESFSSCSTEMWSWKGFNAKMKIWWRHTSVLYNYSHNGHVSGIILNWRCSHARILTSELNNIIELNAFSTSKLVCIESFTLNLVV